ncbi:MAG TPA: hypothetical protein VF260_07720 [Bacilli bacterium]
MKIRIIPLLTSAVVLFAVLLGGWFAYRSYAMENPLAQTVNHLPGVQRAEVAVSADQVTIAITPKNNANLRTIYDQLLKKGKAVIGNRKLVLTVRDHTNERLEKLWANMLFQVAQSMETKQYAMIPAALQNMEKQNPGIKSVAEMDATNVYIQLYDGEYAKYVILPRIPERIGVWPNE